MGKGKLLSMSKNKSAMADRAALADHLFSEGLALESARDVRGAKKKYEESIQICPRPSPLTNLGNIMVTEGRWDEAERLYLKALSLEGSALIHYNLGSLYDEWGRSDEAIRYYEEAIKISPRYGEPQYNLGVLLLRLGRSFEALKYLKAFITLEPNDEPWVEIAKKEVEKLKSHLLWKRG